MSGLMPRRANNVRLKDLPATLKVVELFAILEDAKTQYVKE